MVRPQDDPDFGNGEVGGGRTWKPPVHGVTDNGEPVTASFGQGIRDGHTLTSPGHVSGEEFYDVPGHNHYGPEGQLFGPDVHLR